MIAVSIAISFGAALIEFFGHGKAVVFIPYAIVVPALLLLPRIGFTFSKKIKSAVTTEWLKKMELFSLVVLILNVAGSLILHELGFQYDRFLHFTNGFFLPLGLLLVSLPFRAQTFFHAESKKKILGIIFLIALLSFFLWEGYQYLVDAIFGTTLFFDVKQKITTDFWEDIFSSFLGLLLGLAYLYYAFKKFLARLVNTS